MGSRDHRSSVTDGNLAGPTRSRSSCSPEELIAGAAVRPAPDRAAALSANAKPDIALAEEQTRRDLRQPSATRCHSTVVLQCQQSTMSILKCLSADFSADDSDSSHWFVSAGIGGVVNPKAAVESDVAGAVDAITPVENPVGLERLEPRAHRPRQLTARDSNAAATEQRSERGCELPLKGRRCLGRDVPLRRVLCRGSRALHAAAGSSSASWPSRARRARPAR